MDTILGIKGKDFVLLASDTMQSKSILVINDDKSKIHRLTEYSAIAVAGDGGDSIQFTDFISKNLQLYKIVNGYHLSPRSAAHFTRKNLADYLRSNTRYFVYMLLAGYDQTDGPDLHFIDYFGSGNSINFGGHGSGSLFCGSIFQNLWHDNLDKGTAYEILQYCVAEIQKRLLINLRNFDVVLVDAKGVRNLPSINPSSLPSSFKFKEMNSKLPQISFLDRGS